MPRFGLVGPSYEAQSPNLDAQRTINFYVEQDESGAGNAPIALLSTPGIQSFVDLTPVIPPPVEHKNPTIVDGVGYNWDIAGGVNVGNARTNVPVLTQAIEVGDFVFVLFGGTFAATANYILSITSPMLLAGSFTQIGPTMDMGVTNGLRQRWFQVFCAKAENPVALHALLININLTSTPNSDFDYGGQIMLIRNLDALHEVVSGFSNVSPTSISDLVIADERFVLSMVQPAESALTITSNPPWFRITGSDESLSAAWRSNDGIHGDVFKAPAGSYQGQWNQLAGPYNLALITAAFSLVPV